MIGISTERHDSNGQGPDVLWLLPDAEAWVIEAKSRKSGTKALTKEEHGQLLVAEEWFRKHYKGAHCQRVSVHARSVATKAAAATDSYALTYEKLTSLISDARTLLTQLCESQLPSTELVAECARQLVNSPVEARRLSKSYLTRFVDE